MSFEQAPHQHAVRTDCRRSRRCRTGCRPPRRLGSWRVSDGGQQHGTLTHGISCTCACRCGTRGPTLTAVSTTSSSDESPAIGPRPLQGSLLEISVHTGGAERKGLGWCMLIGFCAQVVLLKRHSRKSLRPTVSTRVCWSDSKSKKQGQTNIEIGFTNHHWQRVRDSESCR